jgi:DNA repair photolyase
MILIREIVTQVLIKEYLSIEAEHQLRQLLQTKYGEEDLDAFLTLQDAAMTGRVRQESRENLLAG